MILLHGSCQPDWSIFFSLKHIPDYYSIYLNRFFLIGNGFKDHLI